MEVLDVAWLGRVGYLPALRLQEALRRSILDEGAHETLLLLEHPEVITAGRSADPRNVLLEAGVSRYDAKVEPHHHFQCQQCGSIEDIGWDAMPVVEFDRLRIGLQAHAYEITVRGCCDRCQES